MIKSFFTTDVKKSKSALIFFGLTFFISAIYIFLLSGDLIENKSVLAIAGNYTRPANSTLRATEWNTLLSDFLAYNKATISLDMNSKSIYGLPAPVSGTDAANRGYVETKSVAGAPTLKNSAGSDIKIICGIFVPTNPAQWVVQGPDVLSINIPTNGVENFSGPMPPLYFASMAGNSGYNRLTGINSIYSPTNSGFTLYLREPNNNDPNFNTCVVQPFTPAMAMAMGLYISWCGYQAP